MRSHCGFRVLERPRRAFNYLAITIVLDLLPEPPSLLHAMVAYACILFPFSLTQDRLSFLLLCLLYVLSHVHFQVQLCWSMNENAAQTELIQLAALCGMVFKDTFYPVCDSRREVSGRYPTPISFFRIQIQISRQTCRRTLGPGLRFTTSHTLVIHGHVHSIRIPGMACFE